MCSESNPAIDEKDQELSNNDKKPAAVQVFSWEWTFPIWLPPPPKETYKIYTAKP